MVMASHWVGLTLPGMIEEPGSFSGRVISPRPERGPEASRRISLAILNRPVAADVIAPCANTYGSCEASASNLLGALTNGRRVKAATRRAKRRAKAGLGVGPGATPGAPPGGGGRRAGASRSAPLGAAAPPA